ncbi:MAG: hypothetical protein HW416_3544 [Chloroflexi bacterium]|nr:hypothetical protein [Steroidobacteraceae bacterium]MBM2812785.1 hypothetical protein [Chloroflexota bacterium]
MASSSSSEDPRRAEIEGTGMAQITLNEGLAWLKTLKKRHEELITLDSWPSSARSKASSPPGPPR